MYDRAEQAEYCIEINEYQCPGFVDRSCSKRTTPSLTEGWGERRCEVVRSDDS
jgi:hypothetical protein